jgi:predicted transcriptional regulator
MLTMPTATTANLATGAADIRGRREHLGLSRLALAAAAGCSNTYLAALEAGCLPRRGDVLARVLEVLNDHEEAVTAA